MSRRAHIPSKSHSSSSLGSHTHIDKETKRGDTQIFRVPDLPSRVRPPSILAETDSGWASTPDFPTEPVVLINSSQLRPPEDRVEWSSLTQPPEVQHLQKQGETVASHRIISTVFAEPPSPASTSSTIPTKHNRPVSRSRLPLADCDKSRHQNNGHHSSTTQLEEGEASSEYFTKLNDMIKKASVDVELKQKSIKESAKVSGKALNGKGKAKGKGRDRRKTCSGGLVLEGRIEKRGLLAIHGTGLGGSDEKLMGKGKEVDRQLPVLVADKCNAMDVDVDPVMAMDVDPRPPPSPPAPPPKTNEKPDTLPVHSRRPTQPSPDSRFEPPRSVASGSSCRPVSSSDSRQSGKSARHQAIQLALSSAPNEESRTRASLSKGGSSSKPNSSSSTSSAPAPPTFFAGSSSSASSLASPVSFSFEASSRNGSSRRSSSARSDYDSVYGSMPVQEPQKRSPGIPKREFVPSPTPDVPGFIHSRGEEKQGRKPQPACDRPQPQAGKRSGPPTLGMKRPHNLPSNPAVQTSQPRFSAPFQRTASGGTRQENIRRALEAEPGPVKKKKEEDLDGPDIHEGRADSSGYSALDISLDSEMLGELNQIEDRLTQESKN
ncbi:hypothetical protein V5O48_000774 [Marasmius crinis-equi]|uniref:Uncharacterized protein n=1 Tax=Marasmius crinis-equi TaxID=585013 RepID=A0ABR3G1H3_9AGAR